MTTEPQKNQVSPPTKNLLSDNRWLIVSAVFIFFVYLMLPVLTPFLIAAILAYICDPLVDKISLWGTAKIKLGRSIATIVVMFWLLSLLILLFFILEPLLQKESSLIAQRLPSVIANVRSSVEPWLQSYFGISLGIDSTQIQALISNHWKTAGDLLTGILKSAGNHTMSLIGIMANILLLPVVLFYLLRDWDGFVNSVGQLIPREWSKKANTVAKEIDLVLAEFLRGQLSVMLAMCIFYVVGLWLVGLDMALAIGLIAGLLGFVPYLGFALGLALALLVAALQFSSLAQVAPVLLVFGIGQIVEGWVLTPKLVGDRIGLHPVVVIFALLAGGQLFGFAGVLLALPVSAAIAVGLRHTKNSYFNSTTYLE